MAFIVGECVTVRALLCVCVNAILVMIQVLHQPRADLAMEGLRYIIGADKPPMYHYLLNMYNSNT